MPAFRILHLISVLVLAILLAAPLPASAAGGGYDDAQLQLLFSGSKVDGNVRRACKGNDEPDYVKSLDWEFQFNADGTLAIRYICIADYGAKDKSETGTWRVKNNELCVDSESGIFNKYVHEDMQCWPIKQGRLFFEGTLPDSSTYWYFKITNPKYSSNKELVTALGSVRGQAVAQSVATIQQPAQSSVQPVAAAPTPTAENALGLPPAEYKGLPKGTKVKFRTDQGSGEYKVTRNEGFEYTYKIDNEWESLYAVFGRSGPNQYTLGSEVNYEAEFNDATESALAGLWPLTVGKSAAIKFEEPFTGGRSAYMIPYPWEIEFQVVRTEAIELNGKIYASYVIREHAVRKTRVPSQSSAEYTAMIWYHPGSGLILKRETEDTRGASSYALVSVNFPEGTTTHALKPSDGASIPMAAAAPAPVPQPSAQATAAAAAMAEDLAAWKAVENSARVDDFQGYLNAHPDGQFATLASIKIGQLTALAAAKQQQELTAWQAIQGSTRVADFENYLNRYPGGLFAGVAADRVAALQAPPAAPAQPQVDEALAEAKRLEDERQLWASVKDSRAVADLQSYIERYPEGLHATDARARVAVLEKFALVANVDFGNYHALVIGIDEYENLPNLKTAVNDARAVADVLKNQYGFRVRFLKNPDRGDILDAFDEYREKLGFRDNLLVYYAGHGWLDEEADRGYWLAADAKPNRRRYWVSNADITDTLKTLQSKHVMVVADSCFSGTLVRGADIGIKGGDYWSRMAEKPARVAITSGGLEPVADAGGGGHSPFANAFIEALTNNETVIDGTSLFNAIRRPVAVAAQQTPQYSDVRNAGHAGGDFLFVKKP